MRPVPQVTGPLIREIWLPVTCDGDSLTLEQFLRGKGCSHHVLMHLKHTPDGIRLNKMPVYSSQLLKNGDLITLRIREPDTGEKEFCRDGSCPFPEDRSDSVPLDVLYEDKDLLVINKPAGLPVYRSRDKNEKTLADAARAYFYARREPFTFHCINRLDRDTSGLLILARHLYSAALLGAAAQHHRITREYMAVVEGVPEPQGTICAPIARKPGSALMREINANEGVPAVTHYQLIASCPGREDPSDGFSLVRVLLETGRTHQIRVHMKSIGHPLPGDFLYNPGHEQIPGTAFRITRQALHARKLIFIHPISGQRIEVTAPWPEDFLPLIRTVFASDGGSALSEL